MKERKERELENKQNLCSYFCGRLVLSAPMSKALMLSPSMISKQEKREKYEMVKKRLGLFMRLEEEQLSFYLYVYVICEKRIVGCEWSSCINGRGDWRSHVMGIGVGGCNLCCGFDKSGLVWSLSKLLTSCLV